ncbi:hypothetical protein BOTBODRAFT_58127 [Botryobasidium botryosum FD-172 SS1]|uniref:F-box domain-containing protein n=1 Tax=Botryobasidium botryosum (strain FD-172 SS1) TaxID=930990 RepID=A0A067MEX6_BOTB1|nr:hypothetical protein BOTBODRAFT_58127 [Botryobasidium botryosum FD-172 SS1]
MLPEDILLQVIHRLSLKGILRLRRTCRSIQRVTQEKLVWLVALDQLDRDGVPIPHYIPFTSLSSKELESMAIHAFRVDEIWTGKAKGTCRERDFSQLQIPDLDMLEWYSLGWSALPGGQWLAIVQEGQMYVCDVEDHGSPLFSGEMTTPEYGYEVLKPAKLCTGWRTSGTEVEAVIVCHQNCQVTDRSAMVHITTLRTLVDIWIVSLPSRRGGLSQTVQLKLHRRINMRGHHVSTSIGETKVAMALMTSPGYNDIIHLISLEPTNASKEDLSFMPLTEPSKLSDEILAIALLPQHILTISPRSLKLFSIPTTVDTTSAGRAFREPDFLEYADPGSIQPLSFKTSTTTTGYTPLRGLQVLPMVINSQERLAFLKTPPDNSETGLPYAFPPSYRCKSEDGQPKLQFGAEGRRALACHTTHLDDRIEMKLHFATLRVDETWPHFVEAAMPPVRQATFDESSGRIFCLKDNRIVVYDMY